MLMQMFFRESDLGVNQNSRDAAVMDMSVFLPLNVELMIHAQTYLKRIQCRRYYHEYMMVLLKKQ